MTSAVEETSLTQRIMMKVLVLGTDETLQAGFITRACQQGVSLHMYPILGVALGISRRPIGATSEVVLQMWTIPIRERLPGLTRQFLRGHRAAIILIRSRETDSLERVMELLTEESRKNLLVILVGTGTTDNDEIQKVTKIVGANSEPVGLTSVDNGTDILAGHLASEAGSSTSLPLVALLDDDACPVMEAPLALSHVDPSTPEEIEIIRSTAESLGYRCSERVCSTSLKEGEIQVSLDTGRIVFKPILCNYCSWRCKKEVNICIVAVDTGWASEHIGSVAMLTLAKLLAFSSMDLSEHVENQIRRACGCSEFAIEEDNPRMESILENLRALGYVSRGPPSTLLDEARRRVKNGCLPESVFNTLRNSLKRAESFANDGEGQR